MNVCVCMFECVDVCVSYLPLDLVEEGGVSRGEVEGGDEHVEAQVEVGLALAVAAAAPLTGHKRGRVRTERGGEKRLPCLHAMVPPPTSSLLYLPTPSFPQSRVIHAPSHLEPRGLLCVGAVLLLVFVLLILLLLVAAWGRGALPGPHHPTRRRTRLQFGDTEHQYKLSLSKRQMDRGAGPTEHVLYFIRSVAQALVTPCIYTHGITMGQHPLPHTIYLLLLAWLAAGACRG